MKRLLSITLLIFIATTVFAQKNSLIVRGDISLPRDSTVKKLLLSDLNGFLAQKDKPNNENAFVLKEDLLETSVLLDEMKDLESNFKLKKDDFYKCYLTNLLKLNDSTFKIQFAFMGVDDSMPVLRASFAIVAQKRNGRFYFHSPLKQNTVAWKSQNIGKTKVYFKTTLNTSKANEYFKLIDEYDRKLSAPDLPTEFYCCDNFNEVLQLVGVDYKSDYNGIVYNTLTAKENDVNLVVNATLTSEFKVFDPHDLWHSRLHNVLSTAIINKPVDEGTAYLYGGSWGLSWKEILDKFKTFAETNKNADWFALYNESKNFDEKAKFPLNVDFVINAIIIQKIEKEKGFPSVIELLSCGKQEKGNENYFVALEKIAGISKARFNESVWALIAAN